MGALFFVGETVIDNVERDDHRAFQVVNRATMSQRDSAGGEDVLEPVGVRPVRKRDGVAILGLGRDNGCLVPPAGDSPYVLDDGRRRLGPTRTTKDDWLHGAAATPNRVENERNLPSHSY